MHQRLGNVAQKYGLLDLCGQLAGVFRSLIPFNYVIISATNY